MPLESAVCIQQLNGSQNGAKKKRIKKRQSLKYRRRKRKGIS
jgi:hypothetical protein